MMAILPIVFSIAEKDISHSHEVTGNVQAIFNRVNTFGNHSLSHCLIADANILHVKVPNNMTHLFQPLDLTMNSWTKNFMREKFAEWYA